MKKQNLAACFSVITLVFTMFGCKIESNSGTKYEEKVYVSAVNFEPESSADNSRRQPWSEFSKADCTLQAQLN